MSVFRIYPEKSNTIASGPISENLNSGQNSVAEIWFGGGGTDINTSLSRRNSVSRHILKFDLTELQSKYSTFEINSGLTISYIFKMKNAIPRDRVLEPEYEFDVLNKAISASYDLIFFPINKDWDEGRGYDLVREQYLVKQKGNSLLSGFSNWNYATSSVLWTEPGVFTNPSANTSLNITQHFPNGDEDIEVDISPLVNLWLTGGTNYGMGIAYRRDYELISGNTRYIASFFTEKTNTAFKPFIEVNYNQVIKDDRHQVSNNRTSRLFLYTFSGNSSVNYYSANTVTIKTASNADFITGLTPTQLTKGVYYVDVLMSAATRGQKYKDIWSGVTFVPGIDKQNIIQTFQIQDNYYTSNAPRVNEYSLITYGIDNNAIISNEESLRVYVDIAVNFSRNAPETAYDLQYRLVMNNQDEVIPWNSLNQIVLNNCPTNYFVLDTSWLLHNQNYQIQFKINELGTSRILSEKIDFRVLRKF